MNPIPTTPVPARRALDNAGVSLPEDLATRTEKEIAALHGMGPKALRGKKEAMQEEGLGFAE